MKRKKVKKSMLMSTVMLGSAMSPLTNVVSFAQDSGNWISSSKVDRETFKKTKEGEGLYTVLRIEAGGEGIPSVPHEITVENVRPEDKGKISIFRNVPQLFNQNKVDAPLARRTQDLPDGWVTKGPYDKEEYEREAKGKDYEGSSFPKKFGDLDKTIYNRFKAGYRGTNFNIPSEVVKNNRNLAVKFKYPGGAKVAKVVYDPNSKTYETIEKPVDLYMTLSEFVFRMGTNKKGPDGKYKDVGVDVDTLPGSYKSGNAGDPHRPGDRNNFDLMFSSSYNPMSAFRPTNIESWKLKVEFKDGDQVIDANYLTNCGYPDAKVIFSFGSLNYYGDTSEAVGLLNPPRGAKAYVTTDSHIREKSYVPSTKKTTHSTYFKFAQLENDFASDKSRWGTNAKWDDVHAGKIIFTADPELGSEANNFDDYLGSNTYYKNAVTFAIPPSSSYEFLLGAHSYAGIGDLYTYPFDNKQYTRLPWGGQNGWQFIQTNAVFKQPPPPTPQPEEGDKENKENKENKALSLFDPKKTVSDDNEEGVSTNRIGKNESRNIVYNIRQRVAAIGSNDGNFYKSFKVEDKLPEGLTFVDAFVTRDGQKLDDIGNVTYDSSTRVVKWEANPDQLGRNVESNGEMTPMKGSFWMNGETYNIIIKARVNPDAKKVMKNTAVTYINGVAHSSNTTETNPNPSPEIKIQKTVTTPSGTNKKETNPDDKTDNVRDTILGEDNIYSIYSDIPEDIETYDKYEIKDTLDKQLTFTPGSVSVKLLDEGNNETVYSDFDQNLSNNVLTVSPRNKDALRGNKKFKVSFKAKLNEDTKPDQTISNSASISYHNKNGENGTGVASNTVNIYSERSEDPSIVKDVEGNPDEYFATKAGKPFEYHIESKLPKNTQYYTKLVFTDELDKRIKLLEKNGQADIKVETVTNTGEKKVFTGYQVHHDKNTNKLDISINDFASLKDQTKLRITLNAAVDGSVKTNERIPNTAQVTYTAPNSTMKTRNTKDHPVYVWINGSDEPTITKKVSGKKVSDEKIGREFEYEIDSSLPTNIETYKYIQVDDVLDDRLDFVENSAKTLVDDEEVNFINPSYDKEARKLSYRIEAPLTKLKDKKSIKLKFKVKLNSKAKYQDEVPNKATMIYKNATMDGEKKITTPEVPIVHPVKEDDTTVVTKTINGLKDSGKVKKGVPFEYNIDVKLPDLIENYKQFIITDELDKKLDFVKLKDVRLDDLKVISSSDQSEPAKDIFADKNNPITYDEKNRLFKLEVPSEKIKNLKGSKHLRVTFIARANTEDAAIGNIAKLTVKDPDDHVKTPQSNNTTLTSEKNNDGAELFKLEKTVEGKNKVIAKVGEAFTYELSTKLPPDIATYKGLDVSDTLDERLSFANKDVKVESNGKALDPASYSVDIKGQKLLVHMKNMDNLTDKLVVKFNAKINRALKKDESIPNTFTVSPTDANGGNVDVSSSNKVDAETPSETKEEDNFTLNKTVNDKGEVSAKKGDSFTYKLDTSLPENIDKYKELTISDELDSRISFTDKDIRVSTNGKELKHSQYKLIKNGQRLEVKFEDPSILGKDVKVTFDATLNRDIDRNEKVPNIYTVKGINPDDKTVKDKSSNEVIVNNPDGKLSANNPVTDPNNQNGKNSNGITGTQRPGNNGNGNNGDNEGLKGEKVKTGFEAVKPVVAQAFVGMSALAAGAYATILHRRKKK